MSSLRQFLQRVVTAFRHERAEDELAREIRSHLALLEKKFLRDGLSPEEARLAAQRAFGGIEQTKELQRDARSFRWIDDTRRDTGYALRSLRRSPSFTVAAVATLAVGIGATTAIYSVVNTVLLQPLPFPGSDRLVTILEPELPRGMGALNYQEFLTWRDRTTTLSAVAAQASNPQIIMPTPEGTARLTACLISTNYFDVQAVQPALGRVIHPSDDANPDVVVLSHRMWQTYFRSSPAAVGSAIELRGSLTSGPSNLGAQPGTASRLLTIVGVLSEEFDTLGRPFDFYTPMVLAAGGRPPGVNIIGRLRDGVFLGAAAEEANIIGAAVRPARPDSAAPLSQPRFAVAGVKDRIVEPMRPALRVFLVAVGVVLLIVCANIANLLLARGTARTREIAVRLALGASRPRIVRQLLTECLVLALIGGSIGALLGAAGVALVKQLATIDAQGIFRLSFGGHLLPRLQEVGVDGRILIVAIGLSAMASVIFGLFPALQLSKVSHLQAMGSKGAHVSRRESAARTGLVISQLVLATMLLVGAGLLVNSFLNLSRVEKGYDPENALAFQLVLPAEYSSEYKAATVESLLAALRDLPGIEHAGFAYAGILLGIQDTVGTFVPPGRSLEEMQLEPAPPRLKSLSHGYLRAMGVPLLSGRHLDQRDDAAAPLAVVVNRTLARQYFGDANPVGVTMNWRPGPMDFTVQIVGVVEDVRQYRVSSPAYAEIFMDYRQVLLVQQRLGVPKQRREQIAFGFLSFGVRTRDDPAAAIPNIRKAVRRVDPNAGVDAIHTMDSMVGYSMARQKFYAVLLGIFATVAAVLAAIGIYGVLAYAVVQRTREIGVRMALGAERRQVIALILRRGLVLAAIGIGVGLVGAIAGAQYLQSMLFGIEPTDVTTFFAVGGAFALVAALASYLPARHATQVDPMVALRVD